MDELTLLEIQDVENHQSEGGMLGLADEGFQSADPVFQKTHCEGTLKGRWIETDQGGFCVTGAEAEELAKKEKCKMPEAFSCPTGSVFDEVSCTCVFNKKPEPSWPWVVAGSVALLALIMAVRK